MVTASGIRNVRAYLMPKFDHTHLLDRYVYQASMDLLDYSKELDPETVQKWQAAHRGIIQRSPMRKVGPDDERCMVFVDGQNMYQMARLYYGQPQLDPILLAQHVVGNPPRRLVGVRYYSGVHDPRRHPDVATQVGRRHDLLRQSTVTVVERSLHYTMEWGFKGEMPDPREAAGQVVAAQATPYQKAREKGIDMAIALDCIQLAIAGSFDTAIILSSDHDMCEIAQAIHDIQTKLDHPVRIEAAVLVPSNAR